VSAAYDSARRRARSAHDTYTAHVVTARRCACATGGWCDKAERLCRLADDAGDLAAARLAEMRRAERQRGSETLTREPRTVSTTANSDDRQR
jgi:hypothetical protein